MRSSGSGLEMGLKALAPNWGETSYMWKGDPYLLELLYYLGNIRKEKSRTIMSKNSLLSTS